MEVVPRCEVLDRDAVGREHLRPSSARLDPPSMIVRPRSSPRIVRYGVVTVTDSR